MDKAHSPNVIIANLFKNTTHTHILKATFFTKGNHSQTLAQVLTDLIPRSHSVYVPFSCGILNFSTQLRNSIKMLFSPLTSSSSVCKLIQGPWKLNSLAKLHGLHSNGFVGGRAINGWISKLRSEEGYSVCTFLFRAELWQFDQFAESQVLLASIDGRWRA